MSTSTKFCLKCSTDLCRLGFDYLNVFKNICENYVEDQEPLEISENISESENLLHIINVLEKHGYLISTETDVDLFKIKPLGVNCSHTFVKPFLSSENFKESLEFFICLKNGSH